MCGIAGFISLNGNSIHSHERFLTVLGDLISHRGPDGYGTWINDDIVDAYTKLHRMGYAHSAETWLGNDLVVHDRCASPFGVGRFFIGRVRVRERIERIRSRT